MEKYDTNHTKRGLAIIFNHLDYDPDLKLPPRKGTLQDEENLLKILKQLGFRVLVFKDSTMQTILNSIEYFSKDEHHIDSDCVMVIVLTHGETGGVIKARDGELNLDQLWNPFKNCASLKDKPKIFVVQACRGEIKSGLTHSLDSKTVSDGIGNVPSTGLKTSSENSGVRSLLPHPSPDFLVAYSTVEDCVSWRHTDDGTWYVNNFCDQLKECQQDVNILTVLTNVNKEVALNFADKERPQAPCFSSSLRRSLFLGKKSGGRYCIAYGMNPPLEPTMCQQCGLN